MPVTAVGKIFKPSLRHDATRRAIETALAPLSAEGTTIEVEVAPHERHGMLTRVTAQPGPFMTGEQVRERIGALLAPFIGYREVRVL
jgi:fatty-acyl-CoA synthase